MTFVRHLTLRQLGEGDALALHAFRAMAARCDQSAVLAAFDTRLGFPGRAALGALHILVRELGVTGGRRLTIACPGCCQVTADELSLIALLSAAQKRDHQRLDAHLGWLLAGRSSETARSAALAFAGLFQGAMLAIDGPPADLSPSSQDGVFPAIREAGSASS
jgi:hypothetical protein